MRKFCFLMFGLLFLAQNALARRDFFVAKEVRCGVGEMCYEIASDMPLNGKLRLYYDDGIVREECEYQNGLRNGVCSEFYPSGKQRVYKVYKAGWAHGGSTTYYESGNILCESAFNQGRLDGARNCFYEEGERKSEEYFVNGIRDGKIRQYRTDGSLANEIIHNAGYPVLARCRQSNGRWVDYTTSFKDYFLRGTSPCGRL